MFRTLRQMFRRKPHPITRRVLADIERMKNATPGEVVPVSNEYLDHLRGGRIPAGEPSFVELDTDTRERIHRKAQARHRTPIWPTGVYYVVGNHYRSTMNRLRDVFYPNPLPNDVFLILDTDIPQGMRDATVMVAEVNTKVIIALHLSGAHLIDPWGKPLDLRAMEETEAERNGRLMKEGAAKRELDERDMRDFHTCRYTEDLPSPPAIVGVMDDENTFRGDGGSFGGAGASGSWDSSPSCDSSTSDSGSCDSSTSGD